MSFNSFVFFVFVFSLSFSFSFSFFFFLSSTLWIALFDNIQPYSENHGCPVELLANVNILLRQLLVNTCNLFAIPSVLLTTQTKYVNSVLINTFGIQLDGL